MKRLICTILATVFVVVFMSVANNSNTTNVNAANQIVYGNFHHFVISWLVCYSHTS